MKKSNAIIGAILATVFIGGSMALIVRNIDFPSFNRLQIQSPTAVEYSISYKMVVDGGEAEDVYEGLFKDEGKYPTTYSSDVGTMIDDLNKRVDITGTTDYNFEGWYLDEALTIKFNGVIYPSAIGDITFYAKISKGYWTKFY